MNTKLIPMTLNTGLVIDRQIEPSPWEGGIPSSTGVYFLEGVRLRVTCNEQVTWRRTSPEEFEYLGAAGYGLQDRAAGDTLRFYRERDE